MDRLYLEDLAESGLQCSAKVKLCLDYQDISTAAGYSTNKQLKLGVSQVLCDWHQHINLSALVKCLLYIFTKPHL